MDKNILDASANDLLALAVSFSGYIGNNYAEEDIAILSGFFNVIGDSLSLYAAVLAKQSTKLSVENKNDCKNKKNQHK